MSFTLAVPESEFDELRAALALEVESAWTATARLALDGSLLLTSELRPVPDESYEVREPLRLRIRSTGFMPTFAAAAKDGLIPVFVHSHPGGLPNRSDLDRTVDAELRELARTRIGREEYASVIIGGSQQAPTVTGRLWRLDSETPEPLDRLRAAGLHLTTLLAHDRPAGPPPAAMFDRHVRAFGPDGQRLLGALTIGVVGAGGTGSPTVEQLARLGVGRVVVVDDDTIDDTNLTRIHQAVQADVGRLKVEVAGDSGQAYGTGTVVEAIPAKMLNGPVIRRLAACDLIFGCTDDHAGRMVLSKLSYSYLVPVIDCGVQVDVADGGVRGVYARITIAAPGAPCLVCRGRVDLARAAAEMLDPQERARRAAEGYVPGIGEHAPAVVAFTTTTSGWAVSEMLARIFGYGSEPPASELLILLHNHEIHATGHRSVPGHYCSDKSQWGRGDTTPPLGLAGLQ